MVLSGWRVLKRWVWDTQARILIGVAISLVLGWLAIRGVEWGLVSDQFQDFPVVWALASLALIVSASAVRARRWQALFLDQKVPLLRLFLVQNAGIGLNNVAPVRVVGEGTQFALLTLRYGVRSGTALATIGMEKIQDMVVTAALLMAGLTLLPGTGEFVPYVVGAFVVAMASVLAIPCFIWIIRRKPLRRLPVLAPTASFLMEMARAKRMLAYSFFLSLAYWLMVGICAWVLAHGMGLGITPFEATLAVLGTLYFTTALPALPAAAGTFEFAVVYALKLFDVPQSTAFSYGVVLHAVLFLPPTIIAAFVLPGAVLKHRGSLPAADGSGSTPVEGLAGGHR